MFRKSIMGKKKQKQKRNIHPKDKRLQILGTVGLPPTQRADLGELATERDVSPSHTIPQGDELELVPADTASASLPRQDRRGKDTVSNTSLQETAIAVVQDSAALQDTTPVVRQDTATAVGTSSAVDQESVADSTKKPQASIDVTTQPSPHGQVSVTEPIDGAVAQQTTTSIAQGVVETPSHNNGSSTLVVAIIMSCLHWLLPLPHW